MFAKILLVTLLTCVAVHLISAADTVNPAEPRRCYSCEGINCQRTTKLNATVTCSNLLDICVTVFDDFTVVAKGCYSDLAEVHREKCAERHNPECFRCFGQLCNNKGRADFSCIECDSSNNSKCATDTSAMTATQCPVPTAPNSYCYVRAGKTVKRGCFGHLQEQLGCMSDPMCSMCLSDDGEACNSFNVGASSASTVLAFNLGTALLLFITYFLR